MTSPADIEHSPLPLAGRRGGLAEVTSLAIPVVLTQISITAMQMVDSVMVGRLGGTELAAVGLGGIWHWTLACFFVGSMNAVQTFVSQHHGAGEARACGGWTWQGMYALAPLVAVGSLLLFASAGQLMIWVGPSAELEPLARGYLRARALGIVPLTMAVAVSSFFRGIGDTRTPLYTTIIANLVNVVLDYGLIFGALGLPQLGVVGAGLATAIAETVYLVAGLCFLWRSPIRKEFSTRIVWPELGKIRRLLRTGLPIGGQWGLEMASFAAFTAIVVRMGDAQMAASQVFIVVLSMSFMQAIGIGIAVSTLVGRYIGAEDLESVEKSFRSGIGLALVLAALIAAIIVAFPEALLALFSKDRGVIAAGLPLLLLGALFQVFDAVAIIADGALRGAGDTRWPLWVRFALSWCVFLPLAYLFGIAMGGGLVGAWLGGLVQVALLAGALVWRFRSGAWREIEI